MKARLAIVAVVGLGLVGGAVFAQQSPVTPVPSPPAAVTVPEWVVKYASNQEQASRACQLQLAQEQAKIEDMTKQLAEAKGALAAAKAADKPAEPKK